MKKWLVDQINRFTSRKFLLTVAGGLVLIANKQWGTLAALIGAYLGVEGAGDAAERFAKPKADAAAASLQETKIQILGADALPETGVDKDSLVPGSSSVSIGQ